MWLALIPLLLEILEKGPSVVRDFIALGRRTGQLTEDQAAAFDARAEKAFQQPYWRPDAQDSATTVVDDTAVDRG